MASHGIRGLAIVAVFLVLTSVPRTRVWKVIERRLVHLTGSRKRAAILVMSVIIVVVLAVDLYELVG